MINNTALLLIDMQEKYLNNLEDLYSLIKHQEKVIQVCSNHKIPIYVFTKADGGKVTSLLENILLKVNFFPIEKKHCSCFKETDLDKLLKKDSITQLILAGVYASECILQSAEEARQLNYKSPNSKLKYTLLVSADLIDEPKNWDFLGIVDEYKSLKWYKNNTTFFDNHNKLIDYLAA